MDSVKDRNGGGVDEARLVLELVAVMTKAHVTNQKRAHPSGEPLLPFPCLREPPHLCPLVTSLEPPQSTTLNRCSVM